MYNSDSNLNDISSNEENELCQEEECYEPATHEINQIFYCEKHYIINNISSESEDNLNYNDFEDLTEEYNMYFNNDKDINKDTLSNKNLYLNSDEDINNDTLSDENLYLNSDEDTSDDTLSDENLYLNYYIDKNSDKFLDWIKVYNIDYHLINNDNDEKGNYYDFTSLDNSTFIGYQLFENGRLYKWIQDDIGSKIMVILEKNKILISLKNLDTEELYVKVISYNDWIKEDTIKTDKYEINKVNLPSIKIEF